MKNNIKLLAIAVVGLALALPGLAQDASAPSGTVEPSGNDSDRSDMGAPPEGASKTMDKQSVRKHRHKKHHRKSTSGSSTDQGAPNPASSDQGTDRGVNPTANPPDTNPGSQTPGQNKPSGYNSPMTPEDNQGK